jgi:hypothetical protein
MATKTVELRLTDHEMSVLADALVQEMSRTCEIVRDHLQDHLNGSSVGLADSRDWLRTLNELAGVLEQLDAPGWRETLGKLQAAS